MFEYSEYRSCMLSFDVYFFEGRLICFVRDLIDQQRAKCNNFREML